MILIGILLYKSSNKNIEGLKISLNSEWNNEKEECKNTNELTCTSKQNYCVDKKSKNCPLNKNQKPLFNNKENCESSDDFVWCGISEVNENCTDDKLKIICPNYSNKNKEECNICFGQKQGLMRSLGCSETNFQNFCNNLPECINQSDCPDKDDCCSDDGKCGQGTDYCNITGRSLYDIDILKCSKNQCRSQYGYCGEGTTFCNKDSMYLKCDDSKNHCRSKDGQCEEGDKYCNEDSLYKPCIQSKKQVDPNEKFIQYNILFPKYNIIDGIIPKSDESLQEQYINICIPTTDKPSNGYPFIIIFEFQDSDGCLIQYDNTYGQSGLLNNNIKDSRLINKYNVLNYLLDNGIAIIFFTEYTYDNKFYEECGDNVGLYSNNNVGINTDNSCFNKGNNPDVYLFNILIWNIFNWNKTDFGINNSKIQNPSTIGNENNPGWPFTIPVGNHPPNKYTSWTHIQKINDFSDNKIHLDLDSMGLWGYSATSLFVSKMIKSFKTLKIWSVIRKTPKLKLAILIGGGSLYCYDTDMYGDYKIPQGSQECYPNSDYARTDVCKSTWANTFVGCCPKGLDGNWNIAGDASPDEHPPTLLLSTPCDNNADKNWSIFYKNAYSGTSIDKDIIEIIGNESNEIIIHGLVKSQVEPLKKNIIKYMK